MKPIVSIKFFSGVLVLLLLIGVSFTSCKKSTYYKLTDDDMSWLVYEDYEMLRFNNGSGDQQTIRVTLRQKSYDQDGDTYSEKTSAYFVQQNDTSSYPSDTNGELYIQKGENGLYVTLSWPHFPLPGYPIHNAPQQIMTLGGINYLDVIVIDGSLLADTRNYVKTIWYSKTNGVVQYEDIFGNTWNKSI